MATRTEPIRGKVAKILNTREVALNVGTHHGVHMGMIFNILSPGSGEVRDPDTGEVLGSVDLTKAAVRVNATHEKFAIAATFRSTRVNVGGTAPVGIDLNANNIRRLFEPPKWETRYETLKIKGGFEAITEELDEENSYVSIGDPVIQVVEHE